MSQNFRCKEPGCRNLVNYTPNDLPAFKSFKIRPTPSRTRKSPKIKTVYLECSNGHTHPYRVKDN